MNYEKFVIDYPASYSPEQVERLFGALSENHPELMAEWISREVPRSEGDPDLKEIHVAVMKIIRDNFHGTDGRALSEIWMRLRGIAYQRHNS